MLLNVFDILQFSFPDLLDILMVAGIIFLLFKWIKNSTAVNILMALLLLLLVRVVVNLLNMRMMTAVMNTVLDVGVLALLIIFQPEIRLILTKIGLTGKISGSASNFMAKLFGIKEEQIGDAAVAQITEACRIMSSEKTGALIVIPHKVSLDHIINTGDIINADVSDRLIRNIFFKNSPLHDGAMVVVGSKVVAARCTLPITSRMDIPARFGMRHKAAIGVTEESDADVIVVSEQTGRISFVRNGQVTKIDNINELKLLIGASFGERKEKK